MTPDEYHDQQEGQIVATNYHLPNSLPTQFNSDDLQVGINILVQGKIVRNWLTNDPQLLGQVVYYYLGGRCEAEHCRAK